MCKGKRKRRAAEHAAEHAGLEGATVTADAPFASPPEYPSSAVAMQRADKARRKRKSAVKKKTIKAMHREINRRVAAVGIEGLAQFDSDVSDHEKFVTIERQCGNIGATLTETPVPELTRHELIRLMALAGLWAQSLARRKR